MTVNSRECSIRQMLRAQARAVPVPRSSNSMGKRLTAFLNRTRQLRLDINGEKEMRRDLRVERTP